MSLRREFSRQGWIIVSNGRPWDDWVYPTEAAARQTADQCQVRNAVIEQASKPGIIDRDRKRQYSQKMLYDSKRKQAR